MNIIVKGFEKVQKDNGYDGFTFLFKYELVKPGAGVEYDKTTESKFEVSVSRTLAKIWDYTETELVKVLFEFSRRVMLSKLINNNLLKLERLELHTNNIGKKKPLDPNKIDDPKNIELEYDIEQLRRNKKQLDKQNRKIGFKYTE